MSRSMREARIKALQGANRGAILVTELGGPKRDRKQMLSDELEKSYRAGSLGCCPGCAGGGECEEASYQEGTVPAYARSPAIDSSRAGVPGWIHRKVMNALPTLAGLGVGLARGAEFGPGPEDTIVAQYPDPTGGVDPQTLGEVILLPEGRTGEAVPTHELGHVAQGRYAGPLLPAAAAGTAGLLQMLGRDPYLESPFETSALEMGQAEKTGGSTAEPLYRAILRAIRGE